MGCGGWAAKNPPNTAMCVTRMVAWVQLPSQNRNSRISSPTLFGHFLHIFCQISFTLLRVFYPGRRNNNRHLLNSSFTHIFHPVGFPLTDKSFLEKKRSYFLHIPDDVNQLCYAYNLLLISFYYLTRLCLRKEYFFSNFYVFI